MHDTRNAPGTAPATVRTADGEPIGTDVAAASDTPEPADVAADVLPLAADAGAPPETGAEPPSGREAGIEDAAGEAEAGSAFLPLVEVPEPDAEAAPSSPIRVAFYRARGVGEDGLRRAMQALERADGFEVDDVSPADVRADRLSGVQLVVFMGGIGSVQGGLLEPEGRQVVRDFVRAGGGYVGTCAGAYLAIQGPPQYHHVAIVAARNWSEDAWKRGIDMLEVRPVGGTTTLRLFYANGPVFRPDPVEGLAPFVPLAEYVSDQYRLDCGTQPGEMPGTPAILAAAYGDGRVVLFSPNPVLAEEGSDASPALFVAAVRWVATRGPVSPDLTWSDVFP